VEFVKSGKSFEEIVPDRVKEKTKSYLQDSDELYSFIVEKYDFIEDKTEVITLKEVFKVYKEFRLAERLSAREMRKITEKNFKETIKLNVNMKKIFLAKTQKKWVREKYGKREITNVFVGLRRKEIFEEDEDDLN